MDRLWAEKESLRVRLSSTGASRDPTESFSSQVVAVPRKQYFEMQSEVQSLRLQNERLQKQLRDASIKSDVLLRYPLSLLAYCILQTQLCPLVT